MADELPIVLFASPRERGGWLEREGASSAGVWLKIAKMGSGLKSVSYAEGLEVVLCFGWIDSQKRAFDDEAFLQRLTPRRPRGRWSRITRSAFSRLIESGRMRAAGLAEERRRRPTVAG